MVFLAHTQENCKTKNIAKKGGIKAQNYLFKPKMLQILKLDPIFCTRVGKLWCIWSNLKKYLNKKTNSAEKCSGFCYITFYACLKWWVYKIFSKNDSRLIWYCKRHPIILFLHIILIKNVSLWISKNLLERIIQLYIPTYC